MLLRALFSSAVTAVAAAVPSPLWAADPIGIIQFNVKGSLGGWAAGSAPMKEHADLLRSVAQAEPLDFISLEEAYETPGKPGVSLATVLDGGWSAIASTCDKDATQIAYSSHWSLQYDLAAHAAASQGWKGCAPGGDGRPYNVALFRNKTSGDELLFVTTHFPHCMTTAGDCLQSWQTPAFRQQIAEVKSKADPAHSLIVVLAGDYNEIAKKFSEADLQQTLGLDGVKPAIAFRTCNKAEGWNSYFDFIMTNRETLDPLKAPQFPADKPPGVQEHKCVYTAIAP